MLCFSEHLSHVKSSPSIARCLQACRDACIIEQQLGRARLQKPMFFCCIHVRSAVQLFCKSRVSCDFVLFGSCLAHKVQADACHTKQFVCETSGLVQAAGGQATEQKAMLASRLQGQASRPDLHRRSFSKYGTEAAGLVRRSASSHHCRVSFYQQQGLLQISIRLSNYLNICCP